MATAILYFIQSVWPFSSFKDEDLRVSDRLVKKLKIPDETKQFVFAIQEPGSKNVAYVLCVQNLSERSSVDTEQLIRSVSPGAVVVQLNNSDSEDVDLICCGTGDDSPLPTSSFQVLKRCFFDKVNTEKFENVAGKLVLRDIFGVGFNEHVFAAKRVAEESGATFLMLDSPFVNLDGGGNHSVEDEPVKNFQGLGLQANRLVPHKVGSTVPSGTRRFFGTDDIDSQIMKSLSLHLGDLIFARKGLDSINIHPKADYEAPQFAQCVYPLLADLYTSFQDIPSIGRALAHAQKMLYDVNRGEDIDSPLLSEVYTFRIAVEGLRIALNNAGRNRISNLRNHSGEIEFSALPVEDKSHALLATALQSQMNKYKSVVAVVDARVLGGLRKNWNTPVPLEVRDMVEQLLTDCTNEEERGCPNRKFRKRTLTDKPVVAVGAGASAVLGASSLSKLVPASTLIKVVTFKIPVSLKLVMTQTQKVALSISKILGPSKVVAPNATIKAAASASKIQTVVHSVIASAEKTSLSAMRTAFYEIMRNRRVRPVGILPWATFGCSIATCTGLLVYGDGIECAFESLPAAPSIASLGRGVQNLHLASQAISREENSRIQNSIQTLIYRFKKWKIQ